LYFYYCFFEALVSLTGIKFVQNLFFFRISKYTGDFPKTFLGVWKNNSHHKRGTLERQFLLPPKKPQP